MFFYDEGFKATNLVVAGFKSKQFLGRIADDGYSLPWLASMAISAGAGDHVEIGTLYGASAMVVAVAKAITKLPGTVYCIDPWINRKGTVAKNNLQPNITEDNLSAKIDDVRENIKRLNETLAGMGLPEAKIELVKSSSQPWPKKLENHKFVTAYIDGLHYGDFPKKDLEECAKRTSYFIGVDNYEETYTDVMDAVHDFAFRKNGKDPEWSILFKNGLFVALRRWKPPRFTRMADGLKDL